jgi:transcriptional regulator with PAS, ATPase and Fis domain
LKDKPDIEGLVGKSKEFKKTLNFAHIASSSNNNVLILGKSGTGKTAIALKIHDLSKRKKEHFISINCASIPSELLESELFGTVKGGGTDLIDRKGSFELADKGTLFLDEIGKMSN